MPLDTAGRFLQKMMATDLNAIAECEEERELAYALEQACRRWADFWKLALSVEYDEARQYWRQRRRRRKAIAHKGNGVEASPHLEAA